MSKWHIGEILLQKKLIDWKQLEDALEEQKRTHEKVGEVLTRKQHIPKFLLFKALAERHGIPFVDLASMLFDPATVGRIPRSVAVKYGFVPIGMKDGAMVVGIGDPNRTLPNSEIAEMAGVSGISTVLSTPEAVSAAIEQHYGGASMEMGASA